MYQGVINVYKEPGYTSFDVVAKLRGILGQKKIGHTGTLDPEAEGVLVVCLGRATKLCERLTDKDKSYMATMQLGVETDTEDMTGTVLRRHEVTVTEEQVMQAVQSFTGTYEQIPPMYSAIKLNGKRLYELARKGVEVERASRSVTIRSIEITEIALPYVTFQVTCSKGTYIRSLCRDIGERLSCGGALKKLVRDSVYLEQAGRAFGKEDALTLARIEQLAASGELDKHILPVEELFPEWPRRRVLPEADKKLYNGNLLTEKEFVPLEERMDVADGIECLVYDGNGAFAAIYRYQKESRAWKAQIMFLQG